jgi:hypothetical protein
VLRASLESRRCAEHDQHGKKGRVCLRVNAFVDRSPDSTGGPPVSASNRVLACVAVTLGLASPSIAQDATTQPDATRQAPLFSNPAYGNGEAYGQRITALRTLVAKKTKADGGTLTPAHEKMLQVRLSRIVAEEKLKSATSQTRGQ